MALNVYFKGMWHIWGRGVLVRKPEGKRPIGDRGIDGRIILRWIFRKWGYGLDQAGSG
jgi:hypothetical protein